MRKRKYNFFVIIIVNFLSLLGISQEISLLEQWNGRYDFLFVGNTMNPIENSFMPYPPTIFTTSSAQINLNPDDIIKKAYLYWAGSGPGDFNIQLNQYPIIADRSYQTISPADALQLVYFCGVKDVTELINSLDLNEPITISDLDVSPYINYYHYYRRTNFAGWALLIIYENQQNSINQINIYDGFEIINEELNIQLSSLNVIDNVGAKIGFVAWEGDSDIAVNETLQINGQILEQLPLNPANNAFNGTNSSTESSNLYNMDLDIYDIQNYINTGDDFAQISLTSGQDMVLISTIVTKLNSQLPDASCTIEQINRSCDESNLEIRIKITNNQNATLSLPEEVYFTLYLNDENLITSTVPIPLAPGETYSTSIDLSHFEVDHSNEQIFKLVVDDIGNGSGQIAEISEINNESFFTLNTLDFQSNPWLSNYSFCKKNDNLEFHWEELLRFNLDNWTIHESYEEAINQANQIDTSLPYFMHDRQQTFYSSYFDSKCYQINQFVVESTLCSISIPTFFSFNEDGMNDLLDLSFLNQTHPNFEILIFNRWGRLLWKGNRNNSKWNGDVSEPSVGHKKATPGTYFYYLDLKSEEIQPQSGYLYITY